MDRTRFERDGSKRRSNLAKHGIDSVDAQQVFDLRPVYEYPSNFQDEMRFISVAQLDQRLVAAIRAKRDDGLIGMISARSARCEERSEYRPLHG